MWITCPGVFEKQVPSDWRWVQNKLHTFPAKSEFILENATFSVAHTIYLLIEDVDKISLVSILFTTRRC